ncbi:MAG: hypothetical protein Q9159_003445 [Coniocarpon cinnabarinum]
MPVTTEPPQHPPDLSKKLPSLGKPRQHAHKPSKSSNPPVETPRLPEPDPLISVKFVHPVRRILSPIDQERFVSSPTHTLITAFAFILADSVIDVPISAVLEQERHSTTTSLLAILQEIEDILHQYPADHNNGSRFGNPKFREFVAAVSSRSKALHEDLLSTIPQDARDGAMDEVTTYFNNAWGSSTRIDYGSGHELNFLIYFLCLNRLSLLPSTCFQQAVLLVFPRYLSIMRELQAAYYLEPAGSHGVWGLDDYHFLPFLFGAAQLHSHPYIRPLAIHNMAVIDSHADDYLYLDMVRQVNSTKTVQGLRWHSPMLDDISGVKEGWSKIYQGMRRMFLHEVIGKLVVMQHFLFGGLIPAAEGMTEQTNGNNSQQTVAIDEAHRGHQHNPNSWNDCCGIQVPSSIGAAQEMQKGGAQQLRPLPFD